MVRGAGENLHGTCLYVSSHDMHTKKITLAIKECRTKHNSQIWKALWTLILLARTRLCNKANTKDKPLNGYHKTIQSISCGLVDNRLGKCTNISISFYSASKGSFSSHSHTTSMFSSNASIRFLYTYSLATYTQGVPLPL